MPKKRIKGKWQKLLMLGPQLRIDRLLDLIYSQTLEIDLLRGHILKPTSTLGPLVLSDLMHDTNVLICNL